MVDDKPAVAGEDGRSPAADLELFPRRNRGGQAVMQTEMAEVRRRAVRYSRRAVRDPDALAGEIDVARCVMAGHFLRTGAREEWPVHDRHRHLSGWIRNCDREDTCVLVVHAVEVEALVWKEGDQTEALPLEQVL